MGQAHPAEKKYTVEAYFELDEKGDTRHEYYDWELFATAGTTTNHNRIIGRLTGFLENIFCRKAVMSLLKM